MSIIETPTIKIEQNIRMIICVIAVVPRLDSSDLLYFIAMLGCGRSGESLINELQGKVKNNDILMDSTISLGIVTAMNRRLCESRIDEVGGRESIKTYQQLCPHH